MTMSLVRVEGITLDVAGCAIFRDTSFSIRQGENWAIVGPTGSGKSLLAMALAGQVPLACGSIRYDFVDAADVDSARFGWFPRGSVLRVSPDDHRRLAEGDGTYYQARWHASGSAGQDSVSDRLTRQSIFAINPFEVLARLDESESFDRRRAEAIETFGLGALLGRAVHHLSHGETKKLVLARAWIRHPRLLILDDPLAGLDVTSRDTLRAALDRLAASGVTLVIVTPRPRELPSCVNRALIVEHRRVTAACSREDLDGRSTDAGSDLAPAIGSAMGSALDPSGSRVPGNGHPPEVLVRLRDVSVRYGSVPVLSNVSFSLLRGECWALLGPNGSGKTTLLSLILADNPQAYSNDVEVFGMRRGTGESIWEIKSRIGTASPEIHAHTPKGLDALDVVLSGLTGAIHGSREPSPEDSNRAIARLREFVPQAIGRSFGELSFAEQRLVLVARAMVGSPELLLLDEPCQGLDAMSRALVAESVHSAAVTYGVSVIYVTHEIDELPPCITHLLELRSGRTVRSGPIRS